jgi:hypothetical protein
VDLLHGMTEEQPDNVKLRRAVSASYYALFHQLNADAVAQIAPNVPEPINHLIQRWFDHGEMKKICGRFSAATLTQPLLGLVGPSVSVKMQNVARSFIVLQDARHKADYDLSYSLTLKETRQYAGVALRALGDWNQVKQTAEGNIFILSLLMWKNWDKER